MKPAQLKCGKCGEMVDNTPRALGEHLASHRKPRHKPKEENKGPPPKGERSEDDKK